MERIRTAQKEMVELLLDKCRPVADLAVKAWIDAAYHTGARPSEVCSLDWADIDWVKREVHIRNAKGYKTVQRNKEKLRVKRQYTTTLHDTYGWLQVWWEKAGRPTSGPVFTGRTGKAWTAIRIQRAFRRLSKLTGLKLTPHSLRHGAACAIAEHDAQQGAHPIDTVRKVRTQLGHVHSSTTWIYLEGFRQTTTPARIAY